MNNNKTVIKLEGVSKKYKLFESKKDRMYEALHPLKKQYHKNFFALNNISLEIRKGEILGVVGMNGSGKSTMLKIISGIIQPSSGAISVIGHIVPMLELGSGFNPEFTGIENIYFYNSLHGYNRKQTDKILSSILDFAEIGNFIYQPLKTYSSGMKARLAFAVSVNIDPDILILDEVLSVGDELFRRKCYAQMESLFNGDKTVIFVSHSVASINQMCSRAVFIDKGEIILEGPTKMVTTQYQRYLFTKKEKKQAVRQEIILLNQNQKLKDDTYAEIAKGSKLSLKKDSDLIKSDKELNKPYFFETEPTEQEAGFIESFIPKSRLEYRTEDVDILDVHITTLKGEKVNALVTGEKYIYSYKVKFNIDAVEVAFSMIFKNEKGQNISTANTIGYGQLLEKVAKGDSFIIQWEFLCNFLVGNYYTNAGVGANKRTESRNLNLIVDAMAFKVLPWRRKAIGGFVNIEINPKITTV